VRAVFRSALVALSALLLLGTAGFAQADDPGSRGDEAYRQGDYAEAMKWSRLAAEQGDADAQSLLGLMYFSGMGVPKNYAEAAKWFRLAAEQGDADAQSLLGLMYRDGKGIPKNAAEATKWFRLAAEQGDAVAQSLLGSLYRAGEGVPQNYVEAVKWTRLAAEQGDADAQVTLGQSYYFGTGVPKNDAEAANWFRPAAEQGDALAQDSLGLLYLRGEGVPKDYVQAHHWVSLAARSGYAGAQIRLGAMYMRGEGVPEDYVQAYVWFNLAAAQGNADAASRRNGLRELLTPAQLAEAQKQSSAEMGRGREPERRPPDPSNDVKATGSAFLVSGIGDLVTNAHVVSECRRLTLADGTLLTMLAYEPASDLALLGSASLAGRSALPLRSGKGIRLADSVMVAGFPLTGIVSPDLNVTTGNVSALSGPDGNRALFQITAPVQSGNSGGPILDQAGNLVGVVVSKLDAVFVANLTGDLPQNVNFGISLGTLQTFLDANDVDYTSQPATRELANASIAEAAKSATFQIVCY
jgi:TPR repeat protein